MYKWIGAVMILGACGGFGFSMALRHKKEEWELRQLLTALDFMECELQYRLTPLPELCRAAARQVNGSIRQVFIRLAEELERQISPDVHSCMDAVLAECEDLPQRTGSILAQLGRSFGRFDLQGQINGLESARETCRRVLNDLSVNRDTRLRSYQTLGLCAGAALVILFV